MLSICDKAFSIFSENISKFLFVLLFTTSRAFSISMFNPSPFKADVSIIVQPIKLDNLSTSILSPFFLTISIILRAIIVGIPISTTCVVRYKFLSILEASIIFIITSGLSSII